MLIQRKKNTSHEIREIHHEHERNQIFKKINAYICPHFKGIAKHHAMRN
jgi:hypothetical protein